MTTHHTHAETISEDELFASWPVTFHPPTRRIVDPPQPVLVNIAAALNNSTSTSFRDGTPLRVRGEGLATDQKVPGDLFAWARLTTGSWLALCAFAIPTGNGLGCLDVRQWVPSNAIAPLK